MILIVCCSLWEPALQKSDFISLLTLDIIKTVLFLRETKLLVLKLQLNCQVGKQLGDKFKICIEAQVDKFIPLRAQLWSASVSGVCKENKHVLILPQNKMPNMKKYSILKQKWLNESAQEEKSVSRVPPLYPLWPWVGWKCAHKRTQPEPFIHCWAFTSSQIKHDWTSSSGADCHLFLYGNVLHSLFRPTSLLERFFTLICHLKKTQQSQIRGGE